MSRERKEAADERKIRLTTSQRDRGQRCHRPHARGRTVGGTSTRATKALPDSPFLGFVSRKMDLSIYIYIHTHMHIYTYTYTPTQPPAHLPIHTHTHTYPPPHTHTRTHALSLSLSLLYLCAYNQLDTERF